MADDPKEPDKGDDDPKDDPKEPDKGNVEAEAAKWKALARKHEAKAKENAEAAQKLKELEDADKSEMDKAKSAATEASKKAEEAELRALKYEIAAEKGLPLVQAKRLSGTSREELESDADAFLEELGDGGGSGENGDGKKPPARKPNERLKGGAQPEDDENVDVSEVVAKIPRL